MRRIALLLGLCVVINSAASDSAQEAADLLLHNGRIFTADNTRSIHAAVVIRGNRIVAVGGNELFRRYRAGRTIDLQGRLVTPGFIDTHIHIRGRPLRSADLAGSASLQELLDRIRAKVDLLEPEAWITGTGWSEDELAEKLRPLKWDLDKAARNNPVVISRAGGHSSVANSAALELAGVTSETPDPEGGIIERTEDGELNGVLRESAKSLVERLVPEVDPAEVRESFVQNLRDLLRLGITSIIHAGVYPPEAYHEWESIYREHGDELPRAAVQIRTGIRPRIANSLGGMTAEQAIDRLREFGLKTGDGNERLRVGPLKITIDGGYTGPAAWSAEPYRDQPDFFGKQSISEDKLYRLSKAAHEMGWQMGVHAIGDAAIEMTVDVWARMLEESPRPDHRHYLNHFTVMPVAPTMRKMSVYNILIAQQPNFTYTLEGRYAHNLVGERMQTNNPLRTPMSHGIFMAMGSDGLPIGPMVGLYAAVARRGMTGLVYGAGERISMQEAIVGYTRNGAYLTVEEHIKGTLEPGKLADLIVLSDDLLTIEPERVMSVQVDVTIVDGQILYERRPAVAGR